MSVFSAWTRMHCVAVQLSLHAIMGAMDIVVSQLCCEPKDGASIINVYSASGMKRVSKSRRNSRNEGGFG